MRQQHHFDVGLNVYYKYHDTFVPPFYATLCCKGMYTKNGGLTLPLYPHATHDIIAKSLDLAFCGTGPSSVIYQENLMIQQYHTIYITSHHQTVLNIRAIYAPSYLQVSISKGL